MCSATGSYHRSFPSKNTYTTTWLLPTTVPHNVTHNRSWYSPRHISMTLLSAMKVTYSPQHASWRHIPHYREHVPRRVVNTTGWLHCTHITPGNRKDICWTQQANQIHITLEFHDSWYSPQQLLISTLADICTRFSAHLLEPNRAVFAKPQMEDMMQRDFATTVAAN